MAKPAKGSKATSPKGAHSKRAAPKVAPAGVSEANKRKRSQIKRRDSDDQADRYLARKLSHVGEARLKTLRSDAGLSTHDYVKAELKRKRCAQGRLSSAFAVQLYKDFNLQGGTWEDLPTPPDSEATLVIVWGGHSVYL